MRCEEIKNNSLWFVAVQAARLLRGISSAWIDLENLAGMILVELAKDENKMIRYEIYDAAEECDVEELNMIAHFVAFMFYNDEEKDAEKLDDLYDFFAETYKIKAEMHRPPEAADFFEPL